MDAMGAVRQMMVACGFLWASKFIYEKNFVKYVLFILVGINIHQSAILLLPFYFIPNKLQIENRRVLLLAFLLGCFVLGKTPAFQSAVGLLQTIAGTTNYENYSEYMSSMLMNGKSDEALNFGPMMLSYLAIPICIIWFAPEMKSRFGKIIPYYDLWYNLAYFYACSYFLVCNLSHLFIRPVLYFSPFQMLMATLLLYYLYKEYHLYGKRQLITIAYCLIICVNTTWDVVKASTSGLEWEITTYKVFFFNSDQRKKINL